jgi:hypothetical protein
VELVAFALSFLVLIANGRAIGSGDTNAMEKTAAALAQHRSVVLPDPGTADPFTRGVPGGRVSIYPVLPALLSAPIFFVFGLRFDLNLTGVQIAGKLSAAFFASVAIALLARTFSRRASPRVALTSALLIGLGTSVYATAQALWQHPVVLFFLVIALDALEQLDEGQTFDPHPSAGLAALALSLAAACRPAVIPMCATLFVYLLSRAREKAVQIIVAAAVPALMVGAYNATLFGAPWRFGPEGLGGRFFAALPGSLGGLLVSPARGLLVFSPIVFVALWGLLGQGRRSFARILMASAGVHFAFIACWNEWHGGESFGPRMLTDLVPPLFFFLPEGLTALPRTGAILGAASIAIQLLGGWTYDYRWERLHQRDRDFDSALWSWSDSPLAFAAREGVIIQGVPEVEGRRIRLRLSRVVPFGPQGSTIEGTAAGLRIGGVPLVRDVRLERGARMDGSWISLSHPQDAVAFRMGSAGASRLRLVGSIDGLLRIETASTSTPLRSSGDFDLDVPFPMSAREDVYVRADTGELRLARIEIRP